jgi:hypothetical protein
MADVTQQLAALEARATSMEKALDTAAPSSSGSSDAQLIARLKQLKAVMEADRAEAEAVRANRDSLLEENAALKVAVEKGNYRALHLKRSLEALDSKK